MIVAFNFARPCQMRRFYNCLIAEGYQPLNCSLCDPGEEIACALRIDTDRKAIVGRNPHYPGRDGDMYGAEIAIDIDKET